MDRHPASPLPAELHLLPRLNSWQPRLTGFPTSLPLLIGREQEITAVRQILRHDDVRLLTLLGPGGMGKTRLAIAVAAESAAEYTDGAVFVALDVVPEADLVLSMIARAFEVRESPGQSPRESLILALQGRRLLLVLDNFEHLLPAAANLAALLAACPGLTALVTSRKPLHLQAERRYVTPPLSLPMGTALQASVLLDEDAVALFVERAKRVRHEFRLDASNAASVVAICQRLEGIPLAIELAAAWCHMLTPAEVLARLESRLPLLTGGPADRPRRFQTMRDAIAWSYDLLSPQEQWLFRGLGIFVGGFTLDAVEWLSATGGGQPASRPAGQMTSQATGQLTPALEHPSTFVLLTALVEASLVQATPTGHDQTQTQTQTQTRFALLETVREFALEQLVAHDELSQAAAAHARMVQNLAARAEPHLFGPEEALWYDRLNAERGNIMAAMAWSLAHQPEQVLRIGAALGVYWNIQGNMGETRSLITRALDAASEAPDTVRARAWGTLASFAILQGDAAAATREAAEALRLAEQGGDPLLHAQALMLMASAHWMHGAGAEALPLLEQSLPRFADATSTTDQAWAAHTLTMLGLVRCMVGDSARGLDVIQEAVNRLRALNSVTMVLMGLGHYADMQVRAGTLNTARTVLIEALKLALELGEVWPLGRIVLAFAFLDATEGDLLTSARRLGAAQAFLRAAGIVIPPPVAASLAQMQDAIMTQTSEASFERERLHGFTRPAEVLAALRADVDQPDVARDEPNLPGFPDSLTARERQILRQIAEGRSDREIAEALFISRKTASNHVTNILRKLGVKTRAAAVAHALHKPMASG